MVVGWYHSHPGFGCWLSGVDINTQQVEFFYTLADFGILLLIINVYLNMFCIMYSAVSALCSSVMLIWTLKESIEMCVRTVCSVMTSYTLGSVSVDWVYI